jgi:hypothetical protein
VKRKGSCVAPKQRIAVLPTMRSPLKVPKTAETERGGILQLRIFWRQSETMEAAKWKKLIARFDPPLSQMRAVELCGYSGRAGQRWTAGDLKIPKAVEIVIRLMLETGCEHPEDLLSWARSRVKGR